MTRTFAYHRMTPSTRGLTFAYTWPYLFAAEIDADTVINAKFTWTVAVLLV